MSLHEEGTDHQEVCPRQGHFFLWRVILVQEDFRAEGDRRREGQGVSPQHPPDIVNQICPSNWKLPTSPSPDLDQRVSSKASVAKPFKAEGFKCVVTTLCLHTLSMLEACMFSELSSSYFTRSSQIFFTLTIIS